MYSRTASPTNHLVQGDQQTDPRSLPWLAVQFHGPAMCTQDAVKMTFDQGCQDADVAVIEGVMGLFDGASGREAKRRIDLITADVEVGRVYEGRVARLMDFGAFVTILPGKDGLVHISQISNERVEKVSDKLAEGDIVKVKVLEVDRQGRVRLSMKEVEAA